ncbi:hypothetical protein UFOVP201_52 [uncultured Caudovirales phage]|uniref:Uncharacterized protein n=1 Tax=uncultured Caudovirales phage TaxID=2100421 RepID=A0A6J7WN51_9CAUD|nr:hypothetical protein UFOVP201_52 [uncultured Caudovirales phage]
MSDQIQYVSKQSFDEVWATNTALRQQIVSLIAELNNRETFIQKMMAEKDKLNIVRILKAGDQMALTLGAEAYWPTIRPIIQEWKDACNL